MLTTVTALMLSASVAHADERFLTAAAFFLGGHNMAEEYKVLVDWNPKALRKAEAL